MPDTVPKIAVTNAGAENEPARTEAAARWWDEWVALRRRDRDAYPDVLGPPDVFTDEVSDRDERRRCDYEVPDGETGPDSRTVTSRLRMSCTEWPKVPTARDLHRAIHQPRHAADETALLLVWFHEADTAEQLYAQLEGAYTWRTLAAPLHRVGLIHGEGARRIDRFATP